MVDRLILGFLSGIPVFRVSKPTKDISSVVLTDFVFREDIDTMKPATSGTFVFTSNGSQNVSLSSFSFFAPPFVIIDSDDQFAPNFFDYYAKLNDSFTTLTVNNVRNIARSIQYFVFENTW